MSNWQTDVCMETEYNDTITSLQYGDVMFTIQGWCCSKVYVSSSFEYKEKDLIVLLICCGCYDVLQFKNI